MKIKCFKTVFRILPVAVLCVFLSGCFEEYGTEGNIEESAAIDVSESFITEYYIAGDVQGALYGTRGLAREKLEGQLLMMKEEGATSDIPLPNRVCSDYKLLDIDALNEESYVLHWALTGEPYCNFRVDVSAVKANEEWHITDFREY